MCSLECLSIWIVFCVSQQPVIKVHKTLEERGFLVCSAYMFNTYHIRFEKCLRKSIMNYFFDIIVQNWIQTTMEISNCFFYDCF